MFGFYRIGVGVPAVKVGNVNFNSSELKKLAALAADEGCSAAVFPELALTGVSCGDLFNNFALLKEAQDALLDFAASTKDNKVLFALGIPLLFHDRIYDCVAIIRQGKISGVVPKSLFAGKRRCGTGRNFCSGAEICGETIFIGNEEIPFGSDLLFTDGRVTLCVDVGDEVSSAVPPSLFAALAGAQIILNCGADIEIAGSSKSRRCALAQYSRRIAAVYAYAGAGVGESTAESVCSGHSLIVENGGVLTDSPRFVRSSQLYCTDIDLEAVQAARLADAQYAASADSVTLPEFRRINLSLIAESDGAKRKISAHPFEPDDPAELSAHCRDIFSIQCSGLAKRFESAHAQNLVLGISGGLDSTLALLVAVETVKLLGRPASAVTAVTMPGFGTTDRTYNNAVGLCKALGVTLREISIKSSCLEHFRAIGHDPETRNVVYENAQARERTQILFDIANGINGICVGTGDLSEAALGWCTFNGDHIANYNVNGSVPKTLIRHILAWAWQGDYAPVRGFLEDVVNTPVSPELLPADENGRIAQKTEQVLGAYEVHDFYIWHFVRRGSSAEKLLFLAKLAFAGKYSDEELTAWRDTFLRRFRTMQFKRSCSPEGPQAGAVALSPRGTWQMPSDLG